MPHILDVQTMMDLLVDLGADVEWLGDNDVRVQVADVVKTELDEELCSKIRASMLLAGPLLARAGRAVVPPPGGDVVGRRRVDSLRGGGWEIAPDHSEVASFIGLGAITPGEIVIDNCRPKDLVAIQPVFDRLGIRMETQDGSIRVPDGQDLAIRDDIGGHVPK